LRNHQEIDMHIHRAAKSARDALGVAAIAYALIAGSAEAGEVTVAIHVNGHGLDLSQPAGAQMLYQRLDNAAYVACTRSNRVGLAPSPDPRGCTQRALANAIRAVNMPLLTQAYLAKHTLGEALAYGIDLPAQVAAK
jgi:UrcA family protein